jgi:hypothetical protein
VDTECTSEGVPQNSRARFSEIITIGLRSYRSVHVNSRPAISREPVVCRPAGCQTVVLRFAVIFRGAPERSNPAAILQAMQGGIEKTVFDLQDILRPSLDGMRYGVSVGRAQNQRPEDQHVQRSLEHFAFERRLASWHMEQYTPVDHRLEASSVYTLQP